MYCTKCGAKIADDAKFCASCGEKVDVQSERAEGDGQEEKQINTDNNMQEKNRDWIYEQAERGIKKNIIDASGDWLFLKITKIRRIRVNGSQLALIFKKYFIDPCDNIQELEAMKVVSEMDMLGHKFKMGSVICWNKAKYRWIKDCDKKIIWKLRSSLSAKDHYKYRNAVKRSLEEKCCELEGIPYDSSSFVPEKMKGKIPLIILTVLVWGFAIWCLLTDGGERSLFADNNDYIETEQTADNDVISQSSVAKNESENTGTVRQDTDDSSQKENKTGESVDNSNVTQNKSEAEESNDNSSYDANTGAESVDDSTPIENDVVQYDYVLETDDGQMEVVMSYTLSQSGNCEFYMNYYDDDGNVVNDVYYGTFAERKEGDGELDLEGINKPIPYYPSYDESTDTAYLVLNLNGEEWYLAELQ